MGNRYRAERGIREVEPGDWEVRARVADPRREGRVKTARRRVKCKTKEEAIAARVKLEKELLEEEAVPSRRSRTTVESFAIQWLEAKSARLKPASADRYRISMAHACVELGPLYLDSVTAMDVERWITGAAAAPATVNGWLRVFKIMVGDACADLGIHNPVARVRSLPEPPPNVEALTAEELGRLLEHVRTAHADGGRAAYIARRTREAYPLLLTLATTGMRWGEATALRWEDLGEDSIEIRRAHWRNNLGSPKNGTGRTAPMVPMLRDALMGRRRRLLEDQDPGLAAGWIFAISWRGGEVRLPNPSTWSKALPRWTAAAGIEKHITPKSFRRTFVDLLRRAGVDEVVEHAIVGHASTAIRRRYSTVGGDETSAAVGQALARIGG